MTQGGKAEILFVLIFFFKKMDDLLSSCPNIDPTILRQLVSVPDVANAVTLHNGAFRPAFAAAEVAASIIAAENTEISAGSAKKQGRGKNWSPRSLVVLAKAGVAVSLDFTAGSDNHKK
jgi:hypothetical protein